MQGPRGLVVGHSAKKGRKQVEWGQVICVLSGFYFAVWMQNESLNLGICFFLFCFVFLRN